MRCGAAVSILKNEIQYADPAFAPIQRSCGSLAFIDQSKEFPLPSATFLILDTGPTTNERKTMVLVLSLVESCVAVVPRKAKNPNTYSISGLLLANRKTETRKPRSWNDHPVKPDHEHSQPAQPRRES
jgi:hypothetical protein